MAPGAPRPLADLLPAAVPGLAERLTEQRIRRGWRALVGVEVARRAQPQALVNGCLQVVVDNSPWLQELTLRAPELVERLRRAFPAVRTLRFQLGRLPAAAPAAPARARRRVPLDAAARDAIESATAVIADPEVAAAARRLLTTAWQAAPARRATR